MRKYVFLMLLFVLSACGAPPAVTPPIAAPPTAAPIAFGTVLGYDEVTTGKHVTEMDVFDKPAGSAPPYMTVGSIHEGERVAILEQRNDGTIRIRTASGVEGWIQIDYLRDVK